jgi:radical SAM protein with 4Fe4S-binding SPASM domain
MLPNYSPNTKFIMLSPRTLKDRNELGSLLPLNEPLVILVDPSSACNLRCKFCPTGDYKIIKKSGRYQGQMKPDVFYKILEDINQFDKPLPVLRLYKEGEPLLNKYFIDFVKRAKRSNVSRIDTTTNGLLLSHKLSEELIESGIDQINISLNGLTNDQYLEYTQTIANVDSIISEIKYLCSISGDTIIYVKCIKEHLTKDQQDEFINLFQNKADKIFLEGLQPNWPQFTFDYIVPNYEYGHYGQELIERKVCPFIFYMMVINSDGSVSACVQDWNHELSMGHVSNSSIKSLWNGDSINKLRKAHLSFNKDQYKNCEFCPVLKYGCLDNIDPYVDRLKPIFKSI